MRDSSTGKKRSRRLGETGDIPVPGRYRAGGRTDFAVWRPSTGTWLVIDSSTGQERALRLGEAGDIPVPGDYDGDGTTDFAVWRPSTGTWWVIESSTGAERSQHGASAATSRCSARFAARKVVLAASAIVAEARRASSSGALWSV